jgi:DNA primase
MRGEATLFHVSKALEDIGIGYEEREGEAWGLCPGHLARTGRQDHSPSWSVNLTTGLHHCFSCGYRGNLPQLVADVTGKTYQQAEAWLTSPETLAAALEGRVKVGRITVPGSRITLPETTLPPLKELEARRISIEAAVRYEILWDGRGFVLPIRDRRHALIGYQLKRGGYVRNVPRRVAKSSTFFGLGAFTGRRAVVVESPLDAARNWTAGVDGSLGAFGSHLSDAQIDLLVAIADEAVIALDDDNAGEIGADAAETKLAWRIWPVRRFRYPDSYIGKDPGDLTDEQVLDGIARARTRLERLTGV